MRPPAATSTRVPSSQVSVAVPASISQGPSNVVAPHAGAVGVGGGGGAAGRAPPPAHADAASSRPPIQRRADIARRLAQKSGQAVDLRGPALVLARGPLLLRLCLGEGVLG